MVADNNQPVVANRGINMVAESGTDNIKPIEESKFVALVIGINEYGGSWTFRAKSKLS